MRLLGKRPPGMRQMMSNHHQRRHTPIKETAFAKALGRLGLFMHRHLRQILRFLWCAGLVVCLVRWLTGCWIFEPFWTSQFQFVEFPGISRIVERDVQSVTNALGAEHFSWPPHFDSLPKLFVTTDVLWPYTLSYLILSGLWMLRVILYRQILDRESSTGMLLEAFLLVPLIALVQNVNIYSSMNQVWVPVRNMAQIGALVLPVTGILQWIVLRCRKKKSHRSSVFMYVLLTLVFAFFGFVVNV